LIILRWSSWHAAATATRLMGFPPHALASQDQD
jgi:hypothetical protein